ncbi:hypothetical protein CLV34_2303 [Luteimicrobium subarcticum]|uniref:Uncharacterized protein n=1 Tax=Luteimicrobium subarcticum TaxID=620910 RepID=A0A2M8WJD9_9MICO|nr:hypothetical protein CLV34_2303 [Luteimicrobium subarcticum]
MSSTTTRPPRLTYRDIRDALASHRATTLLVALAWIAITLTTVRPRVDLAPCRHAGCRGP